MSRAPRGVRGLTLVELVMVSAVIGLFIAIGPKLLIDLYVFFGANSAQLEIQREARQTMDEIQRLLRKGSNASIVSPAGQPPFSQLTLTLPSGGGTIVIVQSGRQLRVTEAGVTRALTNNLCSVFFASPGTGYVSVSLTLEKKPLVNQRSRFYQALVEDGRLMNQ